MSELTIGKVVYSEYYLLRAINHFKKPIVDYHGAFFHTVRAIIEHSEWTDSEKCGRIQKALEMARAADRLSRRLEDSHPDRLP